MYKERVVHILAIAAFLCAASAAAAGSLPPGNRNPSILSGTYGLNFSGGHSEQGTGHRVVGSGSLILDGAGHVTGGILYCNHDLEQFDAPVTGGSYSVNNDGTGYMTIDTSSDVCGGDHGVDLTLTVVSGGSKVLFAADGSENFFETGFFKPFAGEADHI